MEGLRRSSRRALERGGNGQWAIGNGEEGEGEVGRPPPSPLRGDTSPAGAGEAAGNAVLKSYSGNRFDVCMVGIVADGVCGSRMKRGSAGMLRTNREMRGGLAHKGGDALGGLVERGGLEWLEEGGFG